jgi:hypothetical protein
MPRLRPVAEKKDEVAKAAVAAEPEVTIEEPEDQVEVEVTDTPEPDANEATVALQKQLDDLKKSEQIQKDAYTQAIRERDDAVRQAREFNAERARAEKESQEYQVTSIDSALAAAKAEAEKAQADIETAANLGDTKGQADAYRRLARAEARLDKLEDGKEALAARAKEPPPPARTEQPTHIVDTWGLPPNTSVWLKGRPEFISSPANINALKYWADRAEKSGLRAHSDEHIKWVDAKMLEELGGSAPPAAEKIEVKPERQVQVSAPPSRDVPGSNGKRQTNKITLTRDQVEAAKASGISTEEYAKALMKINEMKANGEYGDRQ